MTDSKRLILECKVTFGEHLLYPINEAAEMVCELMSRATLNLTQAKKLRDEMGYTIEMYTPSFDDLLKANRR
tara:strand:+ start:561 stop:776 length:216 start_codon:yes stop_codon:yes gene_type:complete